VAAALGAQQGEWLQRPVKSRWSLLHGLGTLGGLVLADTLAAELGSGIVSRATAFTLRLTRPLEELPMLTAEALEHFATRHEGKLARALGMGPYHSVLPDSIRVGAVRRALEAESLVAVFERATLRTLDSAEERSPAWELL
jgi:hypothetical protein